MSLVDRVLDVIRGPQPDPESVIPVDKRHARTLARADALLANPVIARLEHTRQEQLRGSFRRAGQRLAR